MILSRPVFSYFIEELAISIRTEVVEVGPEQQIVHDHGFLFSVKKENEIWRCEC